MSNDCKCISCMGIAEAQFICSRSRITNFQALEYAKIKLWLRIQLQKHRNLCIRICLSFHGHCTHLDKHIHIDIFSLSSPCSPSNAYAYFRSFYLAHMHSLSQSIVPDKCRKRKKKKEKPQINRKSEVNFKLCCKQGSERVCVGVNDIERVAQRNAAQQIPHHTFKVKLKQLFHSRFRFVYIRFW